MEALFNFKNLQVKGKKYEELDISEIKILLYNYYKILQMPKYTKIHPMVKDHYEYLLSVYQGILINKIDNLSEMYDISYRSNFLAFDKLFKERPNNKNKTSFFEILDPLTNQDTETSLKKQILLDKAIDELINKIKNEKEFCKKFLSYASNVA